MKKRFLIPLIAIAVPLSIGIADAAIHQAGCGLGHQGACEELSRRKLIGKEDNIADAKSCIKSNGASFAACNRVDAEYIPQDLKEQFAVADAKGAGIAAKQKAKKEAALAKMRAAEAKRKAEASKANAAAEAKFKAEGWWEQKPGIFVRWCGGKHGYCPGKESYQDYSWRAMVWCKERACGDIYAKLNISQNGTVVGWTNETAYGGYGQKVVLTFGSYTRGNGRIVEFNARG